MHPATDESASYAFGRFAAIKIIQPPASLSLLKTLCVCRLAALIVIITCSSIASVGYSLHQSFHLAQEGGEKRRYFADKVCKINVYLPFWKQRCDDRVHRGVFFLFTDSPCSCDL